MDQSRTTQRLSIQYLPYAAAHTQCAARTFLSTFNASPWNDNWTQATAELRLNSIVASAGFLGISAMIDNKVIGFTVGNLEPFYDGNTFYLREICVSQDYQQCGVGKKLTENLLSLAKSHHAKRCYLLTRNDVLAYKIYQRWGFDDIAPLRTMVASL